MSGIVTDQNDVLLYETHFPSYGPIRRTAVTPFAPKITQGDHTRDDNIVVSSWVISSLSGGIGIHDAVLPRDLDRFDDSTLLTPYKYITLNPYVHTAGDLGGKADLLVEYDNLLYACVGDSVSLWDEATGAWSEVHTISSTANASAIYNGEMYIVTDIGLHRYNAVTDTWHDYEDPDTFVPGGDYIIEWDGKLFRIGADPSDSSITKMYWTIDPDLNNDEASASTDWTEAGTLHLPRKYCKQLLIYFDLTGEPVIHAVTRIGVYGYEFSSYTFYLTPLTYPSTITSGNGACVWRGELYVPAGTEVYKYNGSTIQVVSPNRDDGLPASLRGDVVQVVPGHGFYYTVISTDVEGSASGLEMQFYTDDTPDVDEVVLFEENPLVGAFPMGGEGQVGAVLQSQGMAWHPLFRTSITGSMGYVLVATVEDTFRLWVSTSDSVYYITLNTGLHNPLQNPTNEFTNEGYVETPWVDMGWVELDKLALSLEIDVDGLDPVEGSYMAVDLAFDGSNAWEEAAVVTTNGLSSYTIGGEPGTLFQRVKLRIRMYRSSDNVTVSPVLRHIVFGFMRRPKLLWGWDLDILLTKKDHYGKSAEELVERLYEITEVIKTAGRFVYRDHRTGILRDRRVLVTNVNGSELTGSDAIGRYTVSIIQLDELDG